MSETGDHRLTPEDLAIGAAADDLPLKPAEIQGRAISGFIWTAIHTTVSIPIAFAVNAVVARVLGPADYGNLAFVSIVLTILAQLSNAGLSDAVLQWGSAAYAQGKRFQVASILSKSLGYHVLIQLPLLVFAISIWPGPTLVVRLTLIAAMILLCAFGSASLLVSVQNRSAGAAKQAMAGNVLLQGAILVSAITTKSAELVWAIRTLASFALLPLTLLLIGSWGRRAAARISIPRQFPAGFWRFALTSMASGLVAMLVFSRSEVVLLKAFGSPEAAGIFALAFGIAAQVTAPVDAMVGPLVPAVTGLVSAHPERVLAGRSRILRASSLLSGGLLAVVIPPLGILMPVIYGAEYAAATVPFFALAATSAFQSICNPLTVFMTARRRAPLLFVVNTVALLVDVVIAVSTIPLVGIIGALVANVVAQFMVFALLMRAELRQTDSHASELLYPLRSWLVGLAVGGCTFMIFMNMPMPILARAGIGFVVGLAGYLVGVRLLDASMTSDDWSALTDSLPRRFRPSVHFFERMLARS